MRLHELFGRAGLEYPEELGDMEITGIVTDSRSVTEGCLFLCIKGAHRDGHDYMDSAISSGARVIVAEQVRDACVGGAAAILLHENTRRSAALLYNAWFGDPSSRMKVIGVTGTNGKTSTCFLLREIFERAGARCGLIGTVRCASVGGKRLACLDGKDSTGMTTPDPEILYEMLNEMAEDGAEYLFMEVSSHALSLHKVDGITFDTVLFTNLTQDHLDFHGTMESYYIAKKRILTLCRRALICVDDSYGKRLCGEGRVPILTCSVEQGDYRAYEIETRGMEGSEFRLSSRRGDFALRIPIPGEFSVKNGMMAAATALEYGISPRVVREALRQTAGVPGRMERVKTDGSVSVLIDYAHTPDALEKLLRTVRTMRRGKERIWLLFGCGGERDRDKRKEMARIACRLADFVVVTSDNSRGEEPEQIFSDILKGMDKEKEFALIPDRGEAIAWAIGNARAGDWLLLAGKGHETYEIGKEGIVPFDERRIVRDTLRRLSSESREAIEKKENE